MYDGNTTGKTDSSGTTNYTWDFENRLKQVTLPGTAGTATFLYDPFGRRIQKVFTQNSTTTTTNYLYDGDNVVETVDQNGSLLAKYAQGQNIDEPLAESVGGATYDYEQDGLGSVTSLTNTSGTVAQSYTFDSFGDTTNSSGSIANPFRYTGRDFDSETGLYYYRARYYSPVTGRFLNEDPIGFSGGTDFYAYVANSPVDWIDPTGLSAELICEPIPSARGGWKFAIPMFFAHPLHCFIHVKCNGYDVTLELYGPSAEDPRHGSPRLNIYNPKRPGRHYPITGPSNDNCCQFENKLLNAFRNDSGNVPLYNPLGPNSNTFAFQIITEAGGSVDMPIRAIGWDYLPPAPASSH